MMAETPVVWELRVHATSQEPGPAGGAVGNVGFGYGGSGALVPQQKQQESGDEMKGRAVWVMGRKAVETTGDDNGQSYVPSLPMNKSSAHSIQIGRFPRAQARE